MPSHQKYKKGTNIKAIINAKLIVNGQIVEGKTLLFDTQIIEISNNIDLSNTEIIDAKGHYVSPGFIDIHIHGSGAADVMDASFDALETISTTLAQTGTTSFLATTMTMSTEAIDNEFCIDNGFDCASFIFNRAVGDSTLRVF